MATDFSLTIVNTTLQNSGTGETKTRRELFYDGSIIERGGHRFRINYPPDEDHEAPWEDGDGRGIVSDWTTRDKKPGERELTRGHRSKRFFDWAGTIAKAKEEGWGLNDKERAKLQSGLLKPPTKGQIIEAAVQSEFDHFRRWCNDDWHYIGIVITHLPDGEDDTSDMDYGHAVWGFEDNDDYVNDETNGMIDSYVEELDEAKVKADAAAKEEAEEQERRDKEVSRAIVRLTNAIDWSHFPDQWKEELREGLQLIVDRAGVPMPPKF